MKRYANWDLNPLFKNVTALQEVNCNLDEVILLIKKTEKNIEKISDNKNTNVGILRDTIVGFDLIIRKLGKVESFLKCLSLEGKKEENSRSLAIKLVSVISLYNQLSNKFNIFISKLGDTYWESDDVLSLIHPVEFQINERRIIQSELLNSTIINNQKLFHVINKMENSYLTKISSIISMTVMTNNGKELFVDLLAKLNSKHQHIREESFVYINRSLGKELVDIEKMLFKILQYKNSYHNNNLYKYSIECVNKISINHIDDFDKKLKKLQKILIDFLMLKGKKSGLNHIAWFDIYIPSKFQNTQFTFSEAKIIIISSFKKVDNSLSEFAARVFSDNWIEVTSGNNITNGFCANVSAIGESRIYTTYNNKFRDIITIAHEIGHAFHHYVIKDQHVFNQNFSLCISEAIAIFCENIVLNEMILQGKNIYEKLFFIEQKMQDGVFYLLEMYACYLFELNYTENFKNKKNDSFSNIMLISQKSAFKNSLSVYFPFLWVTQKHLFNTKLSFYNLSYLLGFLISEYLHSIAEHDNVNFSKILNGFLFDSGTMMVEDIFSKYTDTKFLSPIFFEIIEKQLNKTLISYENLQLSLQNIKNNNN